MSFCYLHIWILVIAVGFNALCSDPQSVLWMIRLIQFMRYQWAVVAVLNKQTRRQTEQANIQNVSSALCIRNHERSFNVHIPGFQFRQTVWQQIVLRWFYNHISVSPARKEWTTTERTIAYEITNRQLKQALMTASCKDVHLIVYIHYTYNI